MLFFAAGEKLHHELKMCPDLITQDTIILKRNELLRFLPLSRRDFSLKHLCRKVIRKHLLQADKHTNLFTRVTQLGLPLYLPEYLVYDMSLEKEYTFDDNDDDDPEEDEHVDDSDSDKRGDHNDTFDSFTDDDGNDDDNDWIRTGNDDNEEDDDNNYQK